MKNKRLRLDLRYKEEEELAEGLSDEELQKQIIKFEKELVSLGSRPLVHDFRLLKEELEIRLQNNNRESETDSLTRAKNKKGLEGLLKMEIARAKRANYRLNPEEPAYMFNVAMISINNFEAINDAYGHLAGDYFLKLLADSWKSSKIRETDSFGRYGDCEFMLILPNSHPEKARDSVIIPFRELFYEKSKAKLAELSKSKPLFAGGKNAEGAGIGLSIGITNYPLISITPDALSIISDADEAMYQAKSLNNANASGMENVMIYEKRLELQPE